MKFLALGGAEEVGASCYYYKFGDTGIIVDCGMHPAKKGTESLPDFSLLEYESPDAVIITHAHHDHVGALPYLLRRNPQLRIYATRLTAEILVHSLKHSAKLLAAQMSEDKVLTPYSDEEIEFIIRSINFYDYDEVFNITGFNDFTEGVNISFIEAGHILGSASVYMECKGKTVFHTGDINLSNQYLLKGAVHDALKADVVVTESTYGAVNPVDIPGWKDESDRLYCELNRVLTQGGSVMIPVFALGKTQEILATVNYGMEKSRVIKSRIFTGGISRRFSNIYDKFRYKYTRSNSEFTLKSVPQDNIRFVRDKKEFTKRRSVVLAPGGMADKGTTSNRLMSFWLKQENFAIYFVGYVDKTSMGYKINNAKKGDKIDWLGEEIEIKCDIKKFRFSSHAKPDDLVTMIRNMNPQRVIITHGDENAVSSFGYRILKNLPHIKLHAATKGKIIALY